MPVVIREDREQYMQELRDWLEQERDVPLEEMADFFHRRIDTYEEKMQTWKAAYEKSPAGSAGIRKGCWIWAAGRGWNWNPFSGNIPISM
ncbi:hypothetical protein LC724_31455 [Blautia sp. RD014234]|nr:hypothetical protein [Blautia parvula]